VVGVRDHLRHHRTAVTRDLLDLAATFERLQDAAHALPAILPAGGGHLFLDGRRPHRHATLRQDVEHASGSASSVRGVDATGSQARLLGLKAFPALLHTLAQGQLHAWRSRARAGQVAAFDAPYPQFPDKSRTLRSYPALHPSRLVPSVGSRSPSWVAVDMLRNARRLAQTYPRRPRPRSSGDRATAS
jgi:hypothetical protein